MAQMDGTKFVNSAVEIHVSDMWSFNHEEDHDHHAKKSVLAKVRSKAKKWKHALAKKKHDHEGKRATPTWEGSLYEDEEDNIPEYHGAPMYESELAPVSYKYPLMLHTSKTKQFVPARDLRCKTIVQSAGEDRIFKTPSEIRALTKSVSDMSVARSRADLNRCSSSSSSGRTPIKTLGEMLAPGYTTVPEATQMTNLKIQGSATSGAAPDGASTGEEHVWDKGVSVKEYLKQKLEPGKGERALSQVISEAMSPTKVGAEGETGVVNKMKEAVSSLLGREEPSVSSNVAVSARTVRNSCLPVSTNPRPDLVEEPHERILQMN